MRDFLEDLKKEKTDEANEPEVKELRRPDWTVLDMKKKDVENFVTAITLQRQDEHRIG